MFDEHITNLIILLTGFGSGLFVSIASGTAGALIIPVFTIIAGISIYQTIGTNLLIDCVIGGVAGLIFLRKGKVESLPVIFLCFTGVIFAFIGSRFTADAPEFGLTFIIGVFLVFVGINIELNGIRKNIDFFGSKLYFKSIRSKPIITFLLLGIIIGFLSGFMGMGSAGFVALVLIILFGYDVHTGIGTSLVCMFFIAGSGSVGHMIKGEFLFEPFVIAAVGAAIGAVIGASYINKVDEEKMGKAVGIVICIFGVALIVKSFI